MRYGLLRAIHIMRSVNRGLEAVLKPVAWIGIAVMLLTVVLAVFSRLSGLSMPWTEKAFIVMLPMLAFVVAPIAYRRAANVSLDFLHDMLPPRVARLHSLMIHLTLTFIFLVSLDLTLRKVGVRFAPTEVVLDWVFGLDLSSIRPFRAKIKIPILNIEWRYVFMGMPACITLLLLANVELILRYVLGLLSPNDAMVRPIRTFEEADANRAE